MTQQIVVAEPRRPGGMPSNGQLGRPRAVPVTNVVALAVMAITALPIVAAWRLTRGIDDASGSSR